MVFGLRNVVSGFKTHGFGTQAVQKRPQSLPVKSRAYDHVESRCSRRSFKIEAL